MRSARAGCLLFFSLVPVLVVQKSICSDRSGYFPGAWSEELVFITRGVWFSSVYLTQTGLQPKHAVLVQECGRA